MLLYIVRHGEAHDNKTERSPRIDTPLTQKGIKQAQKTAQILKNTKIDISYTSPYIRAKKTAEIILQHHPETKLIEDIRIKERSFGKREGIKKHKLIAQYPNKKLNDSDLSDIYEIEPTMEHSDSLMYRAKLFLSYIKNKYKDETILIVGHRQMNSALIYTIQQKPYGKYIDLQNAKPFKIKY